MTLKRSWMPRPKSPMRPMSAKRLAKAMANGGYPSSTFLPKLRRTSRLPFGASGVEGSAGGAGALRVPRPRTGGHRLPLDTAVTVRERSAGGWCELQLSGCTGRATQMHHRVTQKAGGRHGAAARRSDRPSNLLFLDASCHDLVTDYPGRAYAYGWSLREHQEPTQAPVLYRGEPSYLDDVGGVHSFETAGA